MNGRESVYCSGCERSFEIQGDFIDQTVHCPYCTMLIRW